jgi:exosortase/archaeosortase family protein
MKYDFRTLLQEEYLIPLKIVIVYGLWKVFHHFALLPGTALHHAWTGFVYYSGCFYALSTSALLSTCGMKAVAEGININLIGSDKQIWVQDHCLAIPVTVIFTGSVLFFKGSVNDKIKFLIIGISGIISINILRLVFVCLAFVYLTPHFYNLHHSVIYVVITYGFIFFMLAKWMDRTKRDM